MCFCAQSYNIAQANASVCREKVQQKSSCSERNLIGRRTESDRTADGIRSGGGRCTVAEQHVQHDSRSTFSIFSPNFYKQKCRAFRDNLYLCINKIQAMKHNRIAMMAFILIQLFAGASQLKAQFRIVDEQDGKPVSGAYVFSSKGTLLCISDADGNVKLQEGMVTISNLAYEPLTVDAAKEKGTVCMKPKAYTLPEVAVGKAEYVKLSGAFRDICRNNGKTILYREGLADFYINIKTGKAKRRVRACRQYELPTLRRLVNFNIAILGEARSFDISRIRFIECDSVSGTSGDSTFYKSHYRGTSADSAIIYLNSHREGVYRFIIDGTKYNRPSSLLLSVKTQLFDWTFSSPKNSWSSLLSYRRVYNYDYRPLPTKEPIATEEINDFVTTDVKTMTKEEAKAEMKDHSETDQFDLPDCLPAIPYDVAAETKDLLKKSFWEM